jgi:NitT/TauT family transport system substrate-binding protein
MRIDRRGALALFGAAVVAPSIARATDTPPVRISYMATDAFAQAMYADSAGFFKQAGLNVELVQLASSSAIAAAVAGSSIDIGLGNPIVVANAIQSGLPFAAIAPSSIYNAAKPQSFMIVEKTSPIQSAKDLAGKTVAVVELKGMTQAATGAWMRAAGVDPSTVKFLEIPFQAMGPALAAGRVDAAFISDTALMSQRSHTRAIGTPYAALAPLWYMSLWYANKEWIAKNPVQARAFVSAIEKSATWANTHQSETAAMLQKYVPLTSEVLAQMTRSDFADKLDPKGLQPVLDAAAREGAIKRAMDAKEMLAPL